MVAEIRVVTSVGQARRSTIRTIDIGVIAQIEIVTPSDEYRTYVNANVGIWHQGKRQRIEWDFPTLAEAIAAVEKEFGITLTR